MNHWIRLGLRGARRVVVATVGSTVVAIGLALLVLPGPAFVVIPIGLGILAIEFEWARRWLQHVRESVDGVSERIGRGRTARRESTTPDEPGES